MLKLIKKLFNSGGNMKFGCINSGGDIDTGSGDVKIVTKLTNSTISNDSTFIIR